MHKIPDFGLAVMKESMYTRTICMRNSIFTEEMCGGTENEEKNETSNR